MTTMHHHGTPKTSRHLLPTLFLLALSVLTLTQCKQESVPPAQPHEPDMPSTPSGPDYASEFFAPTQDGHFHVLVRPSPAPIPFQQIFSLDVQIFQDSARKQPAGEHVSLDDVRATMPAHNHGMNVRPTIAPHPDGESGKFLVEGMRYHMRGEGEDGLWVLELVIQDSSRGIIDKSAISTPCCQL